MAPAFTLLDAPPDWRTLDFISDLHLHAADPATASTFRRYLAGTPADALFILGDLFEAWPGDDELDEPGFAAERARDLQAAALQRPVYFMHGNRDFLVAHGFETATGVDLLPDPTLLAFAGQRYLLTHGDALCLGDTEYLTFRKQVRDPQWQQQLLARPLAERRALAVTLRSQSEDRKRAGAQYADVDAAGARTWLESAGATILLHGHTHKPGDHALGPGLRRVVLSDWDMAAVPPRAEVLRLTTGGLQRVPLA